MDVSIRRESSAHIEAIHALTAAAFREAPHTSHTEQFIVDALREAGELFLSFVAEGAGKVVGHVALSPVTISDGTPRWYGLGPISVAPEHQSRGVGTQLMNRALAELRTTGAAGCVLLGDQRYYQRFGFKPEPGLTLPDVPPEYFQAISFGEKIPTGTVSYSEAFNARG